MKKVKILAIESSCDETASAILEGVINTKTPKFKILSSTVKSQIAIHRKTGGVVPEVAARAHIQNILPVTELSLKNAGLNLNDIDYLAVTTGPGLIVSLLVGVEFIKGLALGSGKTIIPTNHMSGHLYSVLGSGEKINFPAIALVVSGGHTQIILMKNYFSYKVLGETVDDAAGEAFDKVARLLGLPYPGGPEISKLALTGKNDVKFPRPMVNEKNYDFSFSGLKTAVLYHIDKLKKPLSKQVKADIALSFELAATDVLIQKTIKAAQQYKAKTITLVGGVAANRRLRQDLTNKAKEFKIKTVVPPFDWCTDNAKMIAVASYIRLLNKHKPIKTSKIKADPHWEL